MRFSTKSEYGLRAMVQLAEYYQKSPYSLAKIARQENISQAYLERLITKLKKAKLLKSTKGSKGGYELVRAPQKITIREVLKVLEGSLDPFICVSEEKSLVCNFKSCATKKVWQKLQKTIRETLNSITLQDLIK